MMLPGVLSLLPLWALGFAAQRALGIRQRGARGVVLDYVIGYLALGVMGSISVLLGAAPPLWWIYALVLVASAIAWMRRAPVASALAGGSLSPQHHDVYVRVIAGATIMVLLFLVGTALTDRLIWDGWAIWTLRARILFFENGLPPDAFLKPGPYEFAHPEYPLALPLLDWWMFRHAGASLPALASFAGSLWIVALALLVWTHLKARVAPMIASLAVLGLVLFRPITEYAVGGTADVIIAVAMLGVVIELTSAEEASAAASVRAGCFLALAVLSKNEGFALAIIAVFSAAVIQPLGGFRARVIAAFAIPVAMGGAWYLVTRTWGLDVEQVGGLPPVASLPERVMTITGAFSRLASYRSWPPIFLLALLGAFSAARSSNRTDRFGWVLVVSYLLVLAGVYLSTSQDLVWLLRTSLERVVSHAVPALLVLSVCAIFPAHPAAGAANSRSLSPSFRSAPGE
ncbi:MAG TPA: hypothetical protein VGD27_19145 [Longimicrobiales bacterium]